VICWGAYVVVDHAIWDYTVEYQGLKLGGTVEVHVRTNRFTGQVQTLWDSEGWHDGHAIYD